MTNKPDIQGALLDVREALTYALADQREYYAGSERAEKTAKALQKLDAVLAEVPDMTELDSIEDAAELLKKITTRKGE